MGTNTLQIKDTERYGYNRDTIDTRESAEENDRENYFFLMSSFSEKQRNEGKPGTGPNHTAVTWKMFFVIFCFYFLLGFKNIIWQFFFPSKKTGKK